MDGAAIILCAGKGTRMGDDSKNKVCFDCAGVPTVKRIIENMIYEVRGMQVMLDSEISATK